MMGILKKLIQTINRILFSFIKKMNTDKCSFFLVRIQIEGVSGIKLYKTKVERTRFVIKGKENEFKAENCLISNSRISIEGINNQVILDANVKLRGVTINVRGNDCLIRIKQGTTFGGARIVCVGSKNQVRIGKNCLFSDHIEIWGSDTHKIYDEDMNLINKEKNILIKDEVWIGSHVTILKGVTINSGSIIGMRSLVTKDIPANTLNIGMPSRVIKENVSWEL